MSKPWKSSRLGKKAVELQPSRIRREPVPGPGDKPLTLLGKIDWHSREWEIGLGIAGIVLFALAIDAVTVGFSAIVK